jgi:glucose/arabinose dehydrogenase
MRVLAVLLALVGASLSFAADKEKPLTTAEAIKKVNEKVVVEMQVKASKNRLEKRGEIYLDSEEDFHDKKNLAVVIQKKGAAKFKEAGIDDPAAYFKGKTIRVTGTVILEEKRPRIVIEDPNSIKILDKLPKPLVTGLKNPISVAIGTDGRLYVGLGEDIKTGKSAVLVIKDGKAVPFATIADSPLKMVAWREWLFVAGNSGIWRIDRKGKAEVFVPGEAFPNGPFVLDGIDFDEQGTLYACDRLDDAIYQIDAKGKVRPVINPEGPKQKHIAKATRLVMDGMSHLLVVDAATGELLRVKVDDGNVTKVADGFGQGGGLAWDKHGRLYLGDSENGRVFVIPRPGYKPIMLAWGFKILADICLDSSGKFLLVTDTATGTITAISTTIPGQEVDETPMPLESAVAFPKLKWTGWKAVDDKGRPVPLRPLVLTHAGDGSNRVFVATQHGVIHVFPNDQKADKTKVFLDIQDRVVYDDNENEEGFLGLAFHPNYRKNGEFFVFHTTKKAKLTNIVSRFKVSKDDPDKADPASEEVLMEIKKPFWNHDGGTLVFGADGYLYIAVGDGGAANDPFNNGQNLKTLNGKVLRIDVDHKDKGKNYAIPKDNPFVKTKDARPEIWCYGLRNVWRMAFDSKTGKLWASDVGQNLYEEIDHLVAGGNYGWNLREGLHPFGPKGVGPRKDLIEPIWEYHHDVGKSLTGGHVYRGKRLPELDGAYLYADYVTAKIWALRYDDAKKRVTANRPIKDRNLPVMSFGEDEKGEVYYMTHTLTGEGIYWFVRAKK